MFRKVNEFLNGNGNGNNNGNRDRNNNGARDNTDSNSNTSLSASFQTKVEQLQSMGFAKGHAENALEATGGNLEEATNHLLTNQSVLDSDSSSTSQAGNSNDGNQHQDDKNREISRSSNFTARSAASIRAGEAAARRINAPNKFAKNKNKNKNKNNGNKGSNKTSPTLTLSSTKTSSKSNKHDQQHFEAKHSIQIPDRLANKSKEEQILRCAQRLAPYPLAVDTLLQAFTCIKNDPGNVKFRKIDTTSAGYKRVLEGVPGSQELITAIDFEHRGVSSISYRDSYGQTHNPKDLVLISESVDHALLFLGITALEKVRKLSKEYKNEKRRIAFERDVKRVIDGNSSGVLGTKGGEELELIKRAEFLSKVPSEPHNGAGALVQVSIGQRKRQQGSNGTISNSNSNSTSHQDNNVRVLSRRFDGDDILQDVVQWLGTHGSAIPEKIVTREWSLVDLNRYPLVPIDVEGNLNRTLQYIGFWPSGRLEIRASEEEWKEDKVVSSDQHDGNMNVGSSRGLGAAHA